MKEEKKEGKKMRVKVELSNGNLVGEQNNQKIQIQTHQVETFKLPIIN